MAKKHSLIFTIGSKIASTFNPNIAKVSQSIVGVNGHLAGLNDTQKKIAKFRGLKNSLEDDKEKMESLQSEINKMAKELKDTDKPTKTLTKSFEAKKKELAKLKDKTKGEEAALQELRTALKNTGVDTRNLTQDSIRLKNEMESSMKMQASLAKMHSKGESLKDSGKNQLTKGLAEIGIIGIGAKLAIDDESSFADVEKTTGLDGKQAMEFRTELLKATSTIPIMNAGLYDIAAAAGQAGIAQKELARFTKDSAMMAVAFDVEAGKAGDTVATWRTSFKMSQNQAMELGDQVNYLANKVNAKAGDISEVITRIGAVGKNAGFSVAQTAAMGATLIAMGQQTENASTALKNITGTLTKGTAVTKAQSEAYKTLGLDAVEVAENMQMDARGTMIEVLERINELDPAEKGSLISTMFGEEAKTGVSQLADNIGLLQENFDRVADSSQYANSMLGEYEARSKTTENSLILVAKAGQTLASNIAYGLLPVIQKGANATSMIARTMNEWSQEHPGLTKAIIYTATGIAGFNIAMGASKLLFGNILTSGAKVISFFAAKTVAVTADTVATGANTAAENIQYTTRFKSIILTGKSIAINTAHRAATLAGATATGVMTGAQNLLNIALTANPVGVVVAGIAALTGGFVLAYKKSEKFRNMINSIIETAKNLVPVTKIFDKGKDMLNIFHKDKGETTEDAKSRLSFLAKLNPFRKDSSDSKAVDIPQYATGGIVTKPTLAMVGEGGDNEVIIPINSSGRSKTLWEKAGDMLGMTEKTDINISNSNSNVTTNSKAGASLIIEKIEIIVKNDKPEGIKEAIKEGADSLVQKLEEASRKIAVREKRLSFE